MTSPEQSGTRARPAFLITVDTEGDDLWSRPRRITCENARYLPRFQGLCERHGLRPTWLITHEMLDSEMFVEFARDVVARDTGELGTHLHAWNSPPMDRTVTRDDFDSQPFLIEYPPDCMRDKLARLTDRLEETFGTAMTTHRSGRWALDEKYVDILLKLGYRVDCSVTPHRKWSRGSCHVDYRHFPSLPYRMAADDISRPAPAGLLEIPVTIRMRARHPVLEGIERFIPAMFRPVIARLSRRVVWLRPQGGNQEDMIDLVEEAASRGDPCTMFAVHSSELMPGGSPRFRDEAAIERLYEDLDALFTIAARRCQGQTVRDFADGYEAT